MNRRFRAVTLLLCLCALVSCAGPSPSTSLSATPVRARPAPAGGTQDQVSLPNKPDSLKFAVIGDNGTGERPQYDVGQQLASWRARFPFVLVVMMGDNIYGSDRPQDFVRKFEAPYKS